MNEYITHNFDEVPLIDINCSILRYPGMSIENINPYSSMISMNKKGITYLSLQKRLKTLLIYN